MATIRDFSTRRIQLHYLSDFQPLPSIQTIHVWQKGIKARIVETMQASGTRYMCKNMNRSLYILSPIICHWPPSSRTLYRRRCFFVCGRNQRFKRPMPRASLGNMWFSQTHAAAKPPNARIKIQVLNSGDMYVSSISLYSHLAGWKSI